MIDNDERRKVAARLRELAERDGIHHSLDASPFFNICRGLGMKFVKGNNRYVHCFEVLLRIAELIDPNCGEEYGEK